MHGPDRFARPSSAGQHSLRPQECPGRAAGQPVRSANMAAVQSSFGDAHAPALSDITFVPLVDVVLVLLIVFMIPVPAVIGSPPIKVDLPETTEAAMGTPEDLPLHLFLRKETS